MMRAVESHDREYPELVFLYALRALPATDMPAVGAHISGCQVCRHELETLRPVVESLVAWPTGVVRPSASLWEPLAQRISAEARENGTSPTPDRYREPGWRETAPGISTKLLATDAERTRVSMLVRLAPGTEYPAHRHADVEELHLLQGELIIDDRTLYPGDYYRAEPGSVDRRVWSETGCTCILMTSWDDTLL